MRKGRIDSHMISHWQAVKSPGHRFHSASVITHSIPPKSLKRRGCPFFSKHLFPVEF
ncbi:hypothetical protein RE6C_01909 [Rhodopirellula europaea 6C]|uniref:Uncharacterized protein n=1 Tax=Rhodopirellula europaea 6C TaxID=1263867 RepID=M2A7K2_9BACT|nr:hypothetical protein RE6C_01909 [Rhodopirellula europaea 6C]